MTKCKWCGKEIDTRKIPTITSLKEFREMSKRIGARQDWHEPDEEEIDIHFVGNHLDNAFCDDTAGEYTLILTKAGRNFAKINLATLLAYANGYVD